MAKLPDHPYECQCKGHKGGSRTFFAAPPEWFQNKGMPTPRNCKSCRDWIKAQTDEMVICACSTKFRISAKAKISQFKKVGPYEPVTECHSCQEGRRPPKGTKKRPERKRMDEQKKKKTKYKFEDLAHGLTVDVRPITYDASYYDEIIRNKKVTLPNVNWQEERWEHLMHHVPGSEYDWTDPSATRELNLKGKTSPTSFVGFNASFDELLQSVKAQLQQTSSDTTREYEVSSERIVRVTFSGSHDGLEYTFIDRLDSGQYGVASTYDNVKVTEVEEQTWYKRYKDMS